MQAYDNISRLPPWLSDGLCRLSTGGAFTTRELYTDAEEVMFEAQRPVLLNGIEDLATRGDLLDRTLVLTLPRIGEDRRRPEADIWREFELARPEILGAFLDVLSIGLRVYPGVRLRHAPRMADFATWSAAASVGFGWGPAAFTGAYSGNRQTVHEVALESSPVSRAVQNWVALNGEWEGTASELLDHLARFAPHDRARWSGWPGNARALSDALRRLAPNLRESGLMIEFRRGHHGRRLIHLQASTDPASISVSIVSEAVSPVTMPDPWGDAPAPTAPLGEHLRHPPVAFDTPATTSYASGDTAGDAGDARDAEIEHRT
jgi:hypothetical protein